MCSTAGISRFRVQLCEQWTNRECISPDQVEPFHFRVYNACQAEGTKGISHSFSHSLASILYHAYFNVMFPLQHVLLYSLCIDFSIDFICLNFMRNAMCACRRKYKWNKSIKNVSLSAQAEQARKKRIDRCLHLFISNAVAYHSPSFSLIASAVLCVCSKNCHRLCTASPALSGPCCAIGEIYYSKACIALRRAIQQALQVVDLFFLAGLGRNSRMCNQLELNYMERI